MLSTADPPCPTMVMMCTECKAEINAGTIGRRFLHLNEYLRTWEATAANATIDSNARVLAEHLVHFLVKWITIRSSPGFSSWSVGSMERYGSALNLVASAKANTASVAQGPNSSIIPNCSRWTFIITNLNI